MTWAPHVTVAAVIQQGGRYLMVEECPDGQRVFNQPAGHLESGESVVDAVRREVLEETCHPFTPGGLVGIYRWRAPVGETFLRFTFTGEIDRVDPDAVRDPDIIGLHWLTAEQIREKPTGELRSPMVLRSIDDALRRAPYPLELLHEMDTAG